MTEYEACFAFVLILDLDIMSLLNHRTTVNVKKAQGQFNNRWPTQIIS